MKEWHKKKMHWQAAKKVINTIEQAGFEAFIVGGAVRDYYLKKENNDVDIATSALPEEIQAIFHHTIDVGIAHGTVLVLDFGEPIEVTTYRTESGYSDHRRPDTVHFVRNLKEDLKRRDFTMNAMALSKSGDYIDYYNGRQHIDNKVICAVGEPLQRFEEDALRMLRAIRFASQLQFSIEYQTLQAIHQKASTISYISIERIQVELSKIFTSKHAQMGIEYIENTSLSNYLPGKFNTHSWTGFYSEDRQVGWAYFCLVNESDLSLLSAYRCSNKDKLFTKSILGAYESLLNGMPPIDLLRYDLSMLKTACQFAEWQNKVLPFSFDDLADRKSTLPIQHINELAISGRDLMEWSSKKRGAWIKQTLDTAILAVLNGEANNDKQQLKEWFHAFHDEG
ncbi:CCA tRNA nucleotidyltransferase [Solibacillus ferritrahens]|uniref:CCA tRNA nucleotidyltransferase n=2 Tax=Solibacillus merdavium TaxID=2762218 RepID=A0ABR8XRS4_9BACL|nr:CCA tRNA nucleotidyltransferase [Solibacillus merdavium]